MAHGWCLMMDDGWWAVDNGVRRWMMDVGRCASEGGVHLTYDGLCHVWLCMAEVCWIMHDAVC